MRPNACDSIADGGRERAPTPDVAKLVLLPAKTKIRARMYEKSLKSIDVNPKSTGIRRTPPYAG